MPTCGARFQSKDGRWAQCIKHEGHRADHVGTLIASRHVPYHPAHRVVLSVLILPHAPPRAILVREYQVGGWRIKLPMELRQFTMN